MTLKQISNETGITIDALRWRMRKGKTIEEAIAMGKAMSKSQAGAIGAKSARVPFRLKGSRV